jgi:ABC-2 type transport system ATP-binding protein
MLEVERLAGRVVFVSEGRVVADGTPAQVAQHFGRGDLESVFLHLAGVERPTDHDRSPQTEHPV